MKSQNENCKSIPQLNLFYYSTFEEIWRAKFSHFLPEYVVAIGAGWQTELAYGYAPNAIANRKQKYIGVEMQYN